jgi:hypothetical protein
MINIMDKEYSEITTMISSILENGKIVDIMA